MEEFTFPRAPNNKDANQEKFDMKQMNQLFMDKEGKPIHEKEPRIDNLIHMFQSNAWDFGWDDTDH